jgi:HEAT repeat protein
LENRAQNASILPLKQAQLLYDEAESILYQIPISTTQSPLEAALQAAPDMLSQNWIIAALVIKGVSVSMDSVKSYLRNPIPGTDITREAVIRSFGSAHPSPDLAPTLIELLSFKDVEVRRAAALGLRSIGNEASVEALAVTALHDDDLEVRYFAETGLCWATETVSPPCDQQRVGFNRDDAQYTYWAQWAKKRYH